MAKMIGAIRICEICDKYAADDSGMCKKCWRAGKRLPSPIDYKAEMRLITQEAINEIIDHGRFPVPAHIINGTAVTFAGSTDHHACIKLGEWDAWLPMRIYERMPFAE